MSDYLPTAVAEGMMVDYIAEDDFAAGIVPSTSGHPSTAPVPMECEEHSCDLMELYQDDDGAVSDDAEGYETDESELWNYYREERDQFAEPADSGLEMVGQVGRSKNPLVIDSLYEAEWIDSQTAHKRKVQEHTYQVKLLPGATEKLVDRSELFALVIKDLVSKHAARLHYTDGCYVGVKINNGREVLHKNRELMDTPFAVSYKPLHAFNGDSLKHEIAARAQSGRKVNMFNADAKLDVTISTLPYQSGSGRPKKPMPQLIERQSIDPVIKKRSHTVEDSSKSIKNITKNEATEYCLGVAMVQAIAYNRFSKTPKDCVDYSTSLREWERVRDKCPTNPVLESAKELLWDAKIWKKSNFNIQDDITALQRSLPQYNIIVMGADGRDSPLFIGSRDPERDVLGLLLMDKHYQAIKSVPAFMYTRFFCVTCGVKGCDRKAHYTCVNRCRRCLTENCPAKMFPEDHDTNKQCEECGIRFKHEECYKSHKLKDGPLGGKSLCETTRICTECQDSYYTSHGDRHECNQSYCKRCKKLRDDDEHVCYMSEKPAPKKASWKRIFFDLETELVEDSEGQKVHQVIAAVALKSCEHCSENRPNSMEEAKEANCAVCSEGKGRLKIFECVTPQNRSRNVMEELAAYLFDPKNSGFSVVAHNLKGYDGQFILREMSLNSEIHDPEKIMCNGTKILAIIMKNRMRLVDSFSFIPFGLGKFAKAFSVESCEIAKGHFPYGMLRKEYFDYEGEFPALEHFVSESMNVERVAEVTKYHQKMVASGVGFNFAEELIRYCVSDVLVLSAGMSKFEKRFYELTDVVLLQECVTAAGAAITAFRRKFLQEESIALDHRPLNQSINQSAEALRYFHYRAEKEQLPIQTVVTGGEHSILTEGPPLLVDAFISPCKKYPRGLVIDYRGSYYHASPDRYGPDDKFPGDITAREIWARDAKKEALIRRHHDLEIVWSHEVEEERKVNPRLDELLKHNYDYGGCITSESLKGGRTEAFRLLYDIKDGEVIYHFDFVSLYPTSQKFGVYPWGAGTIIKGQD